MSRKSTAVWLTAVIGCLGAAFVVIGSATDASAVGVCGPHNFPASRGKLVDGTIGTRCTCEAGYRHPAPTVVFGRGRANPGCIRIAAAKPRVAPKPAARATPAPVRGGGKHREDSAPSKADSDAAQ